MPESQYFLRPRSSDQTGHVRICTSIISAIDSSPDADDASLGQEFAHQRTLPWAYRKREQRCAAFGETPPMIAPCIDPLTAIFKARILAEGIDRAEGSRLYKCPLEASGVLIHEHELAREMHLAKPRQIRIGKAHYLRHDAFRRRCPTPHSKRCGNFLIVRQCGDVTGDRRINNLQTRRLHVPGQGHRPETELASTVRRRSRQLDVFQAN